MTCIRYWSLIWLKHRGQWSVRGQTGPGENGASEVHVFCGAYRADQMEEVCQAADHIVFNSPRQLATFGPMAKKKGKSLGLRINPECSTQEGHAIYDPCSPGAAWAPHGPSGMPR